MYNYIHLMFYKQQIILYFYNSIKCQEKTRILDTFFIKHTHISMHRIAILEYINSLHTYTYIIHRSYFISYFRTI